MRFADTIGNPEAIEALRSMVDSDRIPHALLLAGPSGIGKMQLARAFISYINCTDRHNGDACGRCPSCRRIAAGNDPDIHYVYPICKKDKRSVSIDCLEQWNQMLKDSPYMDPTRWLELLEAGNSQPQIYVNEADAIAETAALSSYADRFKIFLIWLPERMNLQAANKLLKLLEEPYEDTIFIAVSNEPAQILPTIMSRMRRIEMRPPQPDTILQALMNRGVSQEAAESAATLCGGSLRRAFQLLGNTGETEEFGLIFRDTMRNAYARNAINLRQISEQVAAMGREKIMRLLDYFSRMVRENFIANLSIPPLNAMTRDEVQFASRFAPYIHSGNVETMLSDTDRARADIARNANSKIVLFDYFLQLLLALYRKPNKAPA
ncbi:MAG: DNA polymerase III subunit [Muribaculaceae bacterium]|nr:DNA polymerase III subunit [Muribaculaceae bacterium]